MYPQPFSSENLNLFSPKTMSGVFTGTHSPLFYRVRLGSNSEPNAPLRWYELHWRAEPPHYALYRHLPGQIDPIPAQLASLSYLPSRPFVDSLQSGLDRLGFWLHACGSCRFWTQSLASSPGEAPVGQCHWRQAEPDLAMQSALAPACANWQKVDPRQGDSADSPPDAPLSADHPCNAMQLPRTKPKPGIWDSWRSRFRLSETEPAQVSIQASHIAERSGAGAGAQPCLVCHGRIANLGALAVETPEGDSQTFSIWRCRACCSLFLNDWIDRWERLDTLETEESYYRLAPNEAHEILLLFDSMVAPDHSVRHDNRTQQRLKIQDCISHLQPLSHQVKRGR